MRHAWIPMFGVAMLVAACGGGGGSPAVADVTVAVPASASASTAGMVAYLSQLAAAPSETAEPLDVSTFAPPQPDDIEPLVLN
jgi:hypothetical protein